MATRSFIAIKNGETFDAIYVHWDGSPETRLPLLENHYNDSDKVKGLIDMGSCSALREDLTSSIFYHRDRNETLNTHRNLTLEKLLEKAENSNAEYVYMFVTNKWILTNI